MFRDFDIVYICKNDIDVNYPYLSNHGFANFKKSYLKDEFDEYIDYYGADEIKLTGSQSDPKRQRHTKFINLYNFYRFVVKRGEL